MITTIITTMYIAAGIISVGACAPQIARLMQTKDSASFSLSTWIMWTATQFVTLAYVISIQAILMVLVNIVWVSFYGAMTCLIIRYRRRTVLTTGAELVPVPVTADE